MPTRLWPNQRRIEARTATRPGHRQLRSSSLLASSNSKVQPLHMDAARRES